MHKIFSLPFKTKYLKMKMLPQRRMRSRKMRTPKSHRSRPPAAKTPLIARRHVFWSFIDPPPMTLL
jgi:hypothetical protein